MRIGSSLISDLLQISLPLASFPRLPPDDMQSMVRTTGTLTSPETQVTPATQPRGICTTGVNRRRELLWIEPLLTPRQCVPEPDWVSKLRNAICG
jgi:hypothetical protein